MTFSFDVILLIVAGFSGALYGYLALMRMDAPPEKRGAVNFWRDVFALAATVLALRALFLTFPAMQPDHFFFLITFAAGALYAVYAVARRDADAERRKVVYFWRDLFVCFIAVFLFRGFFFDYFRIPSNSMQPTLAVGDVVLTDKNAYGYRLPLLNIRLSAGIEPRRGDIVVFRKPNDDLFYIKRIIAVPGDALRYGEDKTLSINGEPLTTEAVEDADFSGREHLRERLPRGGWHGLLRVPAPNILYQNPAPDDCRLLHTSDGDILSCDVPAGRYFVLGDNRDFSNDSRFWGFVPRENIVGPAFRVLFNWRRFNRLWLSLRPSES